METSKNDIIKRLRRIEGQIKGIERMVEGEQECSNILIQIAAVRAAINKVGGLILENYSKTCLSKAVGKDLNDESINNLIDVIIKFTK
ncbi:metal-sensitive transcriptional regulator [Fonticella tunisiensis]|uniref:DNA-binding FrmR family transcriptional regulator n=1 Tax=Fonticella tunisiensis TaxID=1096341 RepID=A0A4R7K7M1_9CLOT|nr:metal-sensitive transcriptional regulator [Fonticella tunisiensis]TDT45777.1 DNA-binding FrmR family transcriptional regulator [Fonticella tunisiensis]